MSVLFVGHQVTQVEMAEKEEVVVAHRHYDCSPVPQYTKNDI
jgi:hypothetical protein